MKLKVFSIFDDKAKAFVNPFFMPHNGLALRALSDVVQDKNTNISRHPGDFSLYILAEFDDNSGEFVSLERPEFLARALDYVEPERKAVENVEESCADSV